MAAKSGLRISQTSYSLYRLGRGIFDSTWESCGRAVRFGRSAGHTCTKARFLGARPAVTLRKNPRTVDLNQRRETLYGVHPQAHSDDRDAVAPHPQVRIRRAVG